MKKVIDSDISQKVIHFHMDHLIKPNALVLNQKQVDILELQELTHFKGMKIFKSEVVDEPVIGFLDLKS